MEKPSLPYHQGFLLPENSQKVICWEVKSQAEPIPGIVKLDREYVRAKSRQVFAYGVAYNLTGNRKYLSYAKAGVDYLRANALVEYGERGAYTYFDKTGKGQPEQ
ncbi:MAG: hypothetical protein ACKOPK_08335, partial [Dolichospermum sp.]